MNEYWLNTEWYNIHTEQKATIVSKNEHGVITLEYSDPTPNIAETEESHAERHNWSESLFQKHWRTADQDLSYDAGKTHVLGGQTFDGWQCAEDCWCKGN
jgi:hypothetical protein